MLTSIYMASEKKKLLFNCFTIPNALHENIDKIETNPDVITYNIGGKETIK